MAKYLITGGCGFIGAQLTKKLIAKGDEVTIIDDLSNGGIISPQATFVQQDIRVFDRLSELFIGLDGCFHLAAIPTVRVDFNEWLDFNAINLTGGLNIFKAAIEAGNVPVVYASSCSVYDSTKNLPLSETQFTQPLSSYGCDKLSLELNANFLNREYQLPSIGLRFFNVYGPHQVITSPYANVITRFIKHILDHEPLIIYGDGEQTRDFVYIEDIVDNTILAMNLLKQDANVFNICTENETSINQLITFLESYFGQKFSKKYLPANTYESKRSCGSRKKMNAYGFEIHHGFAEGLIKTIEYFVKL